MILVHKQQFPLSSPYAHHRRHPSAPPAVVVQPTKVPGLLSLSKPVQRQQPQQSRQRPSPKSKQVQPSLPPRSTPAPEATSVLKPSPEIIAKKSSPVNLRGRGQAKPKEKSTARSNSHSAVRGRRNNARQQSPPLPTSQAEAPPSPTFKSNNSNPFDPFLDDSNARSKFNRPALIPTLASRPSGKLARRRQPNVAPFNITSANISSKAIPVPRSFNLSTPNLSQSEPSAYTVRPRSGRSIPSRDVFPICDDLTDTEDDSENDSTPPATPTRLRASRFTLNVPDGPRTAPITAPSSAFPFGVSSTPSPVGRKTIRTHTRVPSEGVFAMSSDEDFSAYRGHDIDLKGLLGLAAKRLPLSDESEQEREAAAAAAAAYFASSNFQNSPSPEELPPPSFAFV
ncbi:hypothetical protein J3R30DRAFT_3693776 [Lentinula aciculospora]|uniref:Uncharacterized protein n=1 Tax=Lentinula aciculospora TaxID=153920 RepID=A0A9W9ATW9_9AGAR|nr:hypothetical protein J3R30DRAFT_3693776 [Lentinula aciculospora]